MQLADLAPTEKELRALADRLGRAELIRDLMALMAELQLVGVVLRYDNDRYPFLEVTAHDNDDPASPDALDLLEHGTGSIPPNELQAQLEGWAADHQRPLQQHQEELFQLGLVDTLLTVDRAAHWERRPRGIRFQADVEARTVARTRQATLAAQSGTLPARTRPRA